MCYIVAYGKDTKMISIGFLCDKVHSYNYDNCNFIIRKGTSQYKYCMDFMIKHKFRNFGKPFYLSNDNFEVFKSVSMLGLVGDYSEFYDYIKFIEVKLSGLKPGIDDVFDKRNYDEFISFKKISKLI